MLIDLEPHEWRSERKPEPFFGPNAGYFFTMFAIALIVAPVVTVVVDMGIEHLWPSQPKVLQALKAY